jgi:hypothetical protein
MFLINRNVQNIVVCNLNVVSNGTVWFVFNLLYINSLVFRPLAQKCAHSRYQITMVPEVFTLTPNICGSLVQNLPHVTILKSQNFKVAPEFCTVTPNICRSSAYEHSDVIEF